MRRLGLAGRIAHGFIDSKLTPLVIVAALLLGAFSILETPREEEPQIVVPMLDVFVQMPGASAEEIAQRVSLPMEKLLREIPGVEYVYSISQPGMSMLIVRFYVGIEGRRCHRSDVQQALLEFRSHSAGRFAADHQSPLDRRRSHHGAHAVGQEL